MFPQLTPFLRSLRSRRYFEKRRHLDRKYREVVVALAEVQQAAVANKACMQLFRPDQLDIVRDAAKGWCFLSETFAPPGLVLEVHQQEQLGFVPSNKPLSALDSSHLEALAAQCGDNYKNIAPGPDSDTLRETVRRRLLDIVERFSAGGGTDCLPVGTNILVFGSSGNGFGAANSDLDMCLALPPGSKLQDPPASMGQLAEKLEEAGMTEVNARLTARIPIIM